MIRKAESEGNAEDGHSQQHPSGELRFCWISQQPNTLASTAQELWNSTIQLLANVASGFIVELFAFAREKPPLTTAALAAKANKNTFHPR